MSDALLYTLLALALAAGPIFMGIRYAIRLSREARLKQQAAAKAETEPMFMVPEGAVRASDLAVGETVHCVTTSGTRYGFTLIDMDGYRYAVTIDKKGKRQKLGNVVFFASVSFVDGRWFVGAFAADCALIFEDRDAPMERRGYRTAPVVRLLRERTPSAA